MAAARGAGWLWNPWTDLLIGCAGWSLPLLAISDALSRSHGGGVLLGFSLLTLVCNHPHYAATIARAASSAERRAAYRVYLVHLPLLLAAAGAAMLCWPPLVPAFFTAYVLWSPWHYSGQNFGLLLLVARRAGAAPDRRLLRVAFLASYAVWVVTVQSRPSSDPYVWSLDLPPSLVDPLALAGVLVFLAAGSAALGRMGSGLGWRAVVPPALLLSSQTLWFVAPWVVQVAAGRGVSPVYAATGALAFMHCAQYLWLTVWVARREGGARAWHPWRYGTALVLGGIALFTVAPWIASAAGGADLREATLIVIALVNLHHFLLDAALWKLRDQRTAALLLGTAPPNAAPAAPARRLRPALGWALATALLALAAISTVQQALTMEDATAAELDLARRLNPADHRVEVRRAERLAEAQRLDAALQTLAPLLAPRAANAAGLRLYGNVLVASGRYDQALAHLQRVREGVGLDAPSLVNVGVLLARAGRTGEAVDALSEALRHDPALPAAHLNLAGLCLQRGDAAGALAHYAPYLAAPGAPRDRTYATALLNAAGAAQLARQPRLAAALHREGSALAQQLGAADLLAAAGGGD